MIFSIAILFSWCISHAYLLLPLLAILYSIYARYGTGLSKYPGPFLASITDFYRLGYVCLYQKKLPEVALHEKYGDFVRFGPNLLLISDPRVIKDIYTGPDAMIKSEYYSVADFHVKGVRHSAIFATRDQEWHSKLRRAFGPVFTMSAVASLDTYVHETRDIFIGVLKDKFADKSGAEGRVDLTKWFQYFAFDVLGQLLYGERHGFVETGGDVGDIIKILDILLAYGYFIGHVPWLDYLLHKNPIVVWLEKVGYIDSTFPVIPFAVKHLTSRAQREKKLSAEGEPTGDLLDRMMSLQGRHPEVLTDFEIVNMCAELVFAGSETISATLSALFYHLLKNPQTYRKLQAEVDTALPTPSSHLPFAQAQTLPYLNACLKEIFRLHPASGFGFERVVPPSGKIILGHFIPGGTIVSVNAWVVHRNKEIFGDDAAVWRPERWLEGEAKSREMEKYLFHFGAGMRGCIGRNIALLEILEMVPSLMRTFEMELQDPHKEWTTSNMSVVKPRDCDIRLKKR
ncbi:hypothetical protein BP6252_05423 [Coleophoma cylindrospora]|uniref:Cytochrome P450 n=1 Tax=Coleophoma cylindrospora TaxID=1849047 RepID=A0A3D8RTT0_9HELO|nr:hypothetical protein BP6252_05423 [Coleophoma cylindrospora]